jgi:hypothetical protein
MILVLGARGRGFNSPNSPIFLLIFEIYRKTDVFGIYLSSRDAFLSNNHNLLEEAIFFKEKEKYFNVDCSKRCK